MDNNLRKPQKSVNIRGRDLSRLDKLQEATGLKNTQIVGRALSLLSIYMQAKRAGKVVAIVNKESSTVEGHVEMLLPMPATQSVKAKDNA